MWSPHLTGENYVRSPAFVWSHLSQLPTSPVRDPTHNKAMAVMGQENRQDDSSATQEKIINLSFRQRKTSMELYQHFYSIIVCSSCKDLFEVNAEHPFTQQ